MNKAFYPAFLGLCSVVCAAASEIGKGIETAGKSGMAGNTHQLSPQQRRGEEQRLREQLRITQKKIDLNRQVMIAENKAAQSSAASRASKAARQRAMDDLLRYRVTLQRQLQALNK